MKLAIGLITITIAFSYHALFSSQEYEIPFMIRPQFYDLSVTLVKALVKWSRAKQNINSHQSLMFNGVAFGMRNEERHSVNMKKLTAAGSYQEVHMSIDSSQQALQRNLTRGIK